MQMIEALRLPKSRTKTHLAPARNRVRFHTDRKLFELRQIGASGSMVGPRA